MRVPLGGEWVMRNSAFMRRASCAATMCLYVLLVSAGLTAAQGRDGKPGARTYRGVLGANSKKIKRDGGKTMLWAGSSSGNPDSADSQWYDFTGSSIPAGDLQFGIGKDRIRAIDDPMFVSPGDPRLLEFRHSPYRKDEKPKANDDIRVVGYVHGGEARAYPVALLDGHELVNDMFGDKPVTVGW